MKNPIFCAIDTPDLDAAYAIGSQIKDDVGGLKLGLEFLSAHGPAGVEKINELGAPVFLDTKFYDIPNTVFGAIKALAPLNPFMFNIHASGGKEMMQKSVEALDHFETRPLLLGVTVLTSMDQNDLEGTGVHYETQDQVRRLAALAKESGLDGVVCSAHEIDILRKDLGDDFVLLTPGIRPAGSDVGDQKRIMTPAEALAKGSDYLVIGRPITKAENPSASLKNILSSIE